MVALSTSESIARLIALDWGSTGLRVFLLGDNGQRLATRSAAQGSSSLQGSLSYIEALNGLAGDWLSIDPPLPIIACGMVGSQHGWREVPYLDCAADEQAIAAAALNVHLHQQRLVWILPGLRCQLAGHAPDVMRGEETQVVGALQAHPDWQQSSCIVLPGTHSKWAQIADGKIQGFATHMTGELYALLRTQSVLSRLMAIDSASASAFDAEAFTQGVNAARDRTDQGLSHLLFSVRTLGLCAHIPASGLADYLSGLLIGEEIRTGLAWRDAAGLENTALVLVGESALCERYALALQHYQQQPEAILSNTAPQGLWRLAEMAGLIGEASQLERSA
jgi:2-dehydro-3-deoxygalactonokinase